jgi:ABC-2 type transport system permease protein
MAIGCFASAMTRSQIIATVISLAGGISLFLLSFVSRAFTSGPGWHVEAFSYLDMIEHMQDFARGVVDSRPVTLYLSLTAIFLFLTYKAVESRRWK